MKKPAAPSLSISADRNPPAKVKPVIHDGVRYEAPPDLMGQLVAFNQGSGKELWRLKLADYCPIPGLETDVQDVYLKSLTLDKDGKSMEAVDERGTRYLVDLEKKTFKIPFWPVKVALIEWHPAESGWKYWVEFTLENSLNRSLQLDGESVAERGRVENNLFVVTVDGKPAQYMGMMKKRMRPDKFITVKKGESYSVKVELSEHYPVPAGKHKVSVAFEHTNHFSPDGFVMSSAPDLRTFEGSGYKQEPKPKPGN